MRRLDWITSFAGVVDTNPYEPPGEETEVASTTSNDESLTLMVVLTSGVPSSVISTAQGNVIAGVFLLVFTMTVSVLARYLQNERTRFSFWMIVLVGSLNSLFVAFAVLLRR
ncbi:MAG: hypothetical protein AAFV88_21455 [Planctomycetota bacterium]